MRQLLVIVIALWPAVNASAQYQCQGNQNTGNCPPCYYNTVHIPNYRGTTADGRQKLNVAVRTGNVQGNFDNPPGSGTTDSRIWNAVFGCEGCTQSGTELWNFATDTTSQPGTTNRPPYYFENGQATGENSADIIIISDPSVAYAESDHAHYPVKIFVNPTWAATLTPEELAAVIAHEVGHGGGLGNAYKQGSGCENATTIMQGLNAQAKPFVLTIQDRDVFQMNKYKNHQTNCCANVWDDNAIGPDTGGGGPGGGCESDPCCNDPECCGDPNCGNEWCVIVCDYVCVTVCYEWDEYTGECTDGETDCGPTTCWQECY